MWYSIFLCTEFLNYEVSCPRVTLKSSDVLPKVLSRLVSLVGLFVSFDLLKSLIGSRIFQLSNSELLEIVTNVSSLVERKQSGCRIF